MAKVRLLVWTAAVGAAAYVLLRGVVAPDVEDPAGAAMIVVRAVAGALAAYLFAATLLALRLPRLAPAMVRRLVAGAVGGGLLVTPMVASAESASPTTTEAPPVLHRLSDLPAPSGDVSDAEAPPQGHEKAEESVEEVVIEPGDHLWGIAERALADRLGRTPSDAEIVPFWHAVIELNAGRLRSGNPDLVFAGERVRLPS
jgi:hypothetical protein